MYHNFRYIRRQYLLACWEPGSDNGTGDFTSFFLLTANTHDNVGIAARFALYVVRNLTYFINSDLVLSFS